MELMIAATEWIQKFTRTFYVQENLHPFIYFLYRLSHTGLQGARGLSSSLGGQGMEDTLDTNANPQHNAYTHTPIHSHTSNNLEMPFSPSQMSLDREKPTTQTLCTLQEVEIEPPTLDVQDKVYKLYSDKTTSQETLLI